MKRRILGCAAALLIVAVVVLPVAADTPILSLPTDVQISFTPNGVNQKVMVCATISQAVNLGSATFYVDRTGNLGSATAQIFVDNVASGTPTGNNCADGTNIATSASIDISGLPVAGTCPCSPATITGSFSTTPLTGPNVNVIIGVSITADPSAGTLNLFGNAQTNAAQSLLCAGGVGGCSGNFALCNFVDNCVGYSLFASTPAQPVAQPSTPSTISAGGTPIAYTPGAGPVNAAQITPQVNFNVAAGVNSVPFIFIAAGLFTFTLGPYLIFAKRQRHPEYDIRIG